MRNRVGWIEVSKAAGIAVFVGIMALATLSPRTPVQAGEEGVEFVGSKKCKKCHRKNHKSWEKTKMAKALESLAPGAKAAEKTKAGLDPNTDYRTDPKCLKCHVVGFGEEGGFTTDMDLAKAEKDGLTGVGCEMCHGDAGPWLKKGLHDKDLKDEAVKAERIPRLKELGWTNEPSEEVCTKCHNEDSPFFNGFDYEKQKDEGIHEHFNK